MADNGATCSMSRSGNVWDNPAMESFVSSMKTERIDGKTYLPRKHAKADVFDYVERFCNPARRRSTLGYLNPIAFERQAQVARPRIRETGSSSAIALRTESEVRSGSEFKTRPSGKTPVG